MPWPIPKIEFPEKPKPPSPGRLAGMGLTNTYADSRLFYRNITLFALLICIIYGHVSFAIEIAYLFDKSVLGWMVTIVYLFSLITLALLSRPVLLLAIVLNICESIYLFSHYNVEFIQIALSNWDGRFYENNGLVRIFTENCYSVLRPTVETGTSFFCEYAQVIIADYAEYFKAMRFVTGPCALVLIVWLLIKDKDRNVSMGQCCKNFLNEMTIGKYLYLFFLFLDINLLLVPYYFTAWIALR